MNKQDKSSRTLTSVYFGGTDEVFQPLPFRVSAGKVLRCYLEDADSKPANVEPEKSWHEKGELPPVAVECEVKHNGEWVKCTVIHHANNGRDNLAACKIPQHIGSDVGHLGWFDKFRPLKTERERFVEAAFGCYEMGMSTENFTKALYDAGFKAPEVAE